VSVDVNCANLVLVRSEKQNMGNILSSMFKGIVGFATAGAGYAMFEHFTETSPLVEGFLDSISDASDALVEGVSELDVGDETINNTISKISDMQVPNQDNPVDILFNETFRNTAEEHAHNIPSVLGTEDYYSVIPNSMPELSNEYRALLSPEEIKNYEALDPEKLVKLSIDSNPSEKEFINNTLNELRENYKGKYDGAAQSIIMSAGIGGAIGAPTGLLFGAFNEGKVSTPAKAQAV
jgi:hypothetical protein